jgi:hypothetical protein
MIECIYDMFESPPSYFFFFSPRLLLLHSILVPDVNKSYFHLVIIGLSFMNLSSFLIIWSRDLIAKAQRGGKICV